MTTMELPARLEAKDGNWVLIRGDMAAPEQIPLCPGKNIEIGGVYACGKDSVELCLYRVAETEYAAYGEILARDGWARYTENAMAGNRFATYTNPNGRVLQLGYYPTWQGGTLRIVNEPRGYLPPTENVAYSRAAKTSFAQIGRKAVDINKAPGMSYIMQLADGSFILIDGGPANDDDEAALLDYLLTLTPEGQKPTVAAWFITHAHSDHMALANRFIAAYHDRIEVKMAAYNFPNYESVINAKDVCGMEARYVPMIETFIGQIREYWPEAPHWVIHAGQKLQLADAEIEIVFTHEDLYPGEFTWVNHTSSAFRITAGGRRIMILGDCEKSLCRQMAATFGTYLKSDLLQLTHHGANGASLDLYQVIDPEICFWACSQSKYESDERMLGTKVGYEFNAYIRDESIRVRKHYHSGETTVIPLS